MEFELEIPTEVPVMSLEDVVFFPQSILPLHIFEPRYRRMLEDVIDSDRLFAVARRNLDEEESDGTFEPIYPVATIGVIRASNRNPDGSSNLVLQGVMRVRILSITSEEPYRTIRVEPLPSDPGADPAQLNSLEETVKRELEENAFLSDCVPSEFMEFLLSIDNPDAFLDLTAFALCDDIDLKQRMLETVSTFDRYQIFLRHLEAQIEQRELFKRLQGEIPDADIGLN